MFAFRLHRSYFHSRPYCVDPTSRSFGWCSRRKVVPSSTTIAASSLFVIANTGSENDAAFSELLSASIICKPPTRHPATLYFVTSRRFLPIATTYSSTPVENGVAIAVDIYILSAMVVLYQTVVMLLSLDYHGISRSATFAVATVPGDVRDIHTRGSEFTT